MQRLVLICPLWFSLVLFCPLWFSFILFSSHWFSFGLFHSLLPSLALFDSPLPSLGVLVPKLRSNKIIPNSHCIPTVTGPEFLCRKKFWLAIFFRILRYYLIFCAAPGTIIIYFTKPDISFLVLR